MAKKQLWGFDSEAGFRRSVEAIRRSENDVGSNRVPRESPPVLRGFDFIIGKTSGAIAKGATNGTVTIWDSTSDATAVASTSTTITGVWNPFADLADGKWVLVIQYRFAYLVVQGEC